MSRSERFLNRLSILGEDFLNEGEGFLSKSEEIARGIGSNLSRFVSGAGNLVIGALDSGESVGSFGDSLESFSRGNIGKGFEKLGKSVLYGAKGLLGSTAGTTQTVSSFVPIGLLGTTGLLGYGAYRAFKKKVGDISKDSFDDLADVIFEKAKNSTKSLKNLKKTKSITKFDGQKLKKIKELKKEEEETPELTEEAITLIN